MSLALLILERLEQPTAASVIEMLLIDEQLFYQAWLSPSGKLETNGETHLDIAAKLLGVEYEVNMFDDFDHVLYQKMYKKGYARLVRMAKTLWIDLPRKQAPGAVSGLLRHAKRLAIDNELNELEDNATNRTLWSRADG